MVLASAYALALGGRELKIATVTLDSAFILTFLFYVTGSKSWLDWPIGVLIVDCVALAIFVTLALRSNRFWPLPIAALHIIPVLTPLVNLVGKNLVSDALGLTQGLWGYFQLAILVAATAREQRRNKRAKMFVSSTI